jgi:tRNA-dihydrouridine synthase A
MKTNSHRFCVAPMLDWTDRHCRYFHRLLSRKARLYSEMLTTGAVIHGDRARLLDFDPSEQPLALQLGGSDPKELAQAARIGQSFGYSEINLNLGCPSDRVQAGRFGACLMLEPQLVAEAIKAMRDAVEIEVTVKHRLGVDEQDSEQQLQDFVDSLADAGCRTFIVHARKAWLQGLSPKENREVPPLDYERVKRLKVAFPKLNIIINGGIQNLDEAGPLLESLDGVMLGRAAYHNPWLLAEVDGRLFGEPDPFKQRHEVMAAMLPYLQRHLANGGRLNQVLRHILGLYLGQPGARRWRQALATPGIGLDDVIRAQALVSPTMAPKWRQ